MTQKIDIVVRFAKQVEISDIAKIFRDELNLRPYETGWTLKSSEAKILYYFSKSIVKVALIEGKLAGFVVYANEPWQDGNWIRIKELVVSSDFQEKGVGTRLMSDVEREAKNQRVKNIILEVYKNCPIYNYYKKLNYKDSGWIGMSKELK